MAVETGSASGMIHALNVEVRIMNENGGAPIWANHPDETAHWILDSAQQVFEHAIYGLAHSTASNADSRTFTQTLTVFAVPTTRNQELLNDDLHWLSSRLEEELLKRFQTSQARPVVMITANPGFFRVSGLPTPAAPTADPRGGGEQMSAHPVMAAPGGSGGGYGPPERDDRGRGGAALIWTGAALGGMVIATVLLLLNNLELRAERADAPQYQERAAELALQLRLAREALEFEQRASAFERASCEESVTEHRQMIDELAEQCTPRAPAPEPPPPPAPYPERPNPFDPG